MRAKRRLRGRLIGVLAMAAALLIHGGQAGAQSQGLAPTPEELQIFQGLTPEQQQSILGSLSGNGSGLGGGTLGQRSSSGDQFGRARQGTENEPGREQRRTTEEGDEGEEQTESMVPTLRREEWVIIEIDYQLPPRPVPPYLQSLYAAQAAQAGVSSAAVTAALQSGAASAQNSQNAGQGAQNQGATGGGQNPMNPENLSNANGSPVTAFEVQLSVEERARLDALMTLIRSKNPYRLTRDGVLMLPGFAPIALLGLTEEQATLRLKVEPAFKGVDIRLTQLPLRRTGAEGLKPFGYDLFDHRLSTFAPVTNVPVPSNYIVGPGDELNVQLYGNQNRSLRLAVSRDGHINLPDIGPINVGGQTYDAVKALVEARVQRQMIGVHASISMGDTRSIQVFVLGEARHPGAYTVSGLSTITSALYAAGGVKRPGSLRSILLKRNGALVRQLDLYDLLIRGDSSNDAKLLPGDVILIPPVGGTVSIDGEVRRPAIYEIRSESTLADALELAGGLTPEADRTNAMVTRIDDKQRRIVVPIDLSSATRSSEPVRNGDVLRVMRLRPTLDSGIMVGGYLYTPGAFAYRPGIRLSDVIGTIDELRPDADIHYLLIRRELPPDRHITVLSADLAAALRAPRSAADLELMPRDRLTVFDLASGRDQVIQPLLDELRVQGTSGQPTETVHVDGQVKVPGEYPLEPGMRVSDLIRAGGGAADAAYGGKAELTRYSIAGGGARRTELIEVDLAGAVHGDADADVRLQPFDTLSVREVPLWGEQESVTLKGEVRFPGSYAIRRGETLKSVISRAGGLTEYAFPEGSVFTRDWLRKREQEQLDMLATRMQTDITALAVESAASGQAGSAAAVSVGQSLLSQVRGAKAVGRMVIDLPRLMREGAGSPDDVVLRGGDQLIVPRFQQQVTVLGEVQNSTSHMFNARLSRDDYISLSGGTTRRADRSRIYVVRANGSVVAREGNGWFRRSGDTRIRPGDTIVVPLDTERMPPLPFWQAVTGILYNVAIAVLAVHAL